MGLKVHKDGDKNSYFSRVMECNGLYEIEANINSVVQLEERLEIVEYYII